MEPETGQAERSDNAICVIGDAGGAHVKARVEAMLRCGTEIELLTPRPSGIYGMKETVVKDDGGDDIFGNWSRAIANTKAPIVNIHYGSSHGAWTFALSGDRRPMMLNLMGGDVLADEQSKPHFMARKLTHHVMRRADIVNVKSDFLADAAQRVGVKVASIQKLFWGIDRQVFSPGPELREQLGLSPSRFIIFSPRPLSGFYRIDQVVQALPAMIEAGIDPELVISMYEMEPAFVVQLEKLLADLDLSDRVHFKPSMSPADMADMYRSVDACIGIPPSDAFPQTVLEAMACDCVNVMSALDRYQEFVKDDENVLFSNAAPEVIANVLIRLTQNDELKQRLVNGGRKVIDTLPTLDQSAATLVSQTQLLPASTNGLIPGWNARTVGRMALAALSRRFRSSER